VFELTDESFDYITTLLYDYAKINLTERKRSLVIARLSKRIRSLKLGGFEEYIALLKDDIAGEGEFQKMVDALSTNFSHFFREAYHFDYLNQEILPALDLQSFNLWSAASSTGQEIYSILMTIMEYERVCNKQVKSHLYASDISSEVLTKASRGIFPRKDVEKIDEAFLKRYFLSGKGEKIDHVKIKNDLIKKIRFFKLNLTDPRYDLPLMDVIFLRNVIIYFDKETKIRLIEKMYNAIKPGGFLFLGHSESLSGISDKFRIVGKTIYQRID